MYKELWAMYAQGYGRVRLAVVVCVLAVVISLLEGLNIGLLVPLLESLGSSAPGEKHVISSDRLNFCSVLCSCAYPILQIYRPKYRSRVLLQPHLRGDILADAR